MNDKEFDKIKNLSNKILKKDLLLFWQFTLNNLDKIDIIKNQYQFIEMFLIRCLHLKKILKSGVNNEKNSDKKSADLKKNTIQNQKEYKQETIDQLKNVEQQDKIVSNLEVKNKKENYIIKNFKELIETCEHKKELKIKYELENNVRLVSFKDQKIEISFNSNLNKSFVKDLSQKLIEWTDKRWVIAFSKKEGSPTFKNQKKDEKEKLIKQETQSNFSLEIKKLFPDAELESVDNKNKS